MADNLNLKDVEKKIYISFLQDGLWDIAVGIMVFAFGLELLLDYFYLAGIIALPFILLPSLKKKITLPRMGYVQFNPERKRWIRFWNIMVSVVLSGTAFLGVVMMIIFTGEFPAMREWVQHYGGITAALIVALGAYSAGQVTGVQRYSWYAGLAILLLALFLIFPIPGELFPVILGLVIIATGVILLIRFIRKYPLGNDEGLIAEADDAGA